MSPATEARAHLRKADEFLAAARDNLAAGRYDATTSNAVTCGVQAADAICLALTGEADRTRDHADGVRRLKSAGGDATPLAPTLARLLGYKNQSQYQTSSMSAAKAGNAVTWAERLCSAAREIVTSA